MKFPFGMAYFRCELLVLGRVYDYHLSNEKKHVRIPQSLVPRAKGHHCQRSNPHRHPDVSLFLLSVALQGMVPKKLGNHGVFLDL